MKQKRHRQRRIPGNYPLLVVLLLTLPDVRVARADFVEQFDGDAILLDASAQSGWFFLTGDGDAQMMLSQSDGVGIIEVDARPDRRNIWWAFIRRSIAAHIDTEELARPDRELRVHARIKSSAAPRRVNLHLNHSRTTDFHSHLMEYDIPDSDNWYEISMTTNNFDARPGDDIFVQLALMDWGRERYRLEVDFLTVAVVDPAAAGPDIGQALPYRPPAGRPGSFDHVVDVSADATVDAAWPQVNLADWADRGSKGARPLLSVGGAQSVILRWDLSGYRDALPDGWGVLELTTDRVYRATTGLEEFGELRIVEILDGDPAWTRDTVTFESLLSGGNESTVFNEQMMIDAPAAESHGGKTRIPVSPPVLKRLLSGRTKGLAIRPLGAIAATFHTGIHGPKLYFNLTDAPNPQEEPTR